jgi:hypothetical protein
MKEKIEVYMEMKDICLEGNLIDNGWIESLKYDNGKTNLNAVFLLSEITYWYRPTLIKSETTGQVVGYKKKFAADKWQIRYDELGKRLGLTKGQVKDACDFLRDKGLITIEFRTVQTYYGPLPNVMFIEPVIENLKKITGINRIVEDSQSSNEGYPPSKRNTPYVEKEGTKGQNVTSVVIDSDTNTTTPSKTSPETPPENNNGDKHTKRLRGKKDDVAYDSDTINKVKSLMPEIISDDDINAILYAANGDINKISEKYAMTDSQKIEGLVGWLITAIKNNYKPPIKKMSKRKLSNFKERKYDAKLLEEQLLKTSHSDLL